jgi:hypothetical protein
VSGAGFAAIEAMSLNLRALGQRLRHHADILYAGLP